MNPLKNIFVQILLLLAGINNSYASSLEYKANQAFIDSILWVEFSHQSSEKIEPGSLLAVKFPRTVIDSSDQFTSPCDQILEAEVLASPPGSLPEKVLCKLATDLADFPELRKLFDSADNVGGRFVKSWESLLDVGDGTRKWVRTQVPILERMANKVDEYPNEKVANYYKRHNSNGDVKRYPGTSNNGQYYDKYGHPDFTQDVPIATNGKRAIYKPIEGLDGPGTTDFTKANNWALKPVSEGGGGFDPSNFKKNGTGCKIKDPNSPFKDSDGWVECTWHHHEDGKTLMPVPTVVHNRTNASHIGGVQAIIEGIAGFFDSPVF